MFRGFVCEICDKEIERHEDALETVCVHVDCVPASRAYAQNHHDQAHHASAAAMMKGCSSCGKSHAASPRGYLSRGGLRAVCNSCVRERNAERRRLAY